MPEGGFAWKTLCEDGRCYFGGRGTWDLPNGKPGRWRSVKGELVPCGNGIHVLGPHHIVRWLGPALFEIEYEGEKIDAGDKYVVRKARLVRRVEEWNERTARLFAADCAEDVVHLIPEAVRGPFVSAIDVARRFAEGEASRDELSAAEAAAEAAAGAAARDAARAAAWDAAGAAARDAAWAAAWDAAGVAARAAAGAAAGAAARAAARDAWAAAGAAARAAARERQTEHLAKYVTELRVFV